MATSRPVTPAQGHIEVELYTPSNINFSKGRICQEITPEDDHKSQEQTPSFQRPDKASATDKNKYLKEKGHKLSKRKLFLGQSLNTLSGNESSCGVVEKKKKTEEISALINTKNSERKMQLPLTERQQLAFLLEVTSTQTSSDYFDDESGKESFTKITSARGKGKKNKMVAVNPRVYRRNERGETPLHIAAIKGDVSGMKKLIKDGAQVEAKDYAGWTALHEACNYGNLAAAKLLVGHRAPLNIPGFEGDTPLHDAVLNNHTKVVDMLLSSSANPRQPNTKGKTPMDYITTKEMSEVFTSHGVQLPAAPLHFDSPFNDGNKIRESNKKGKVMPGESKTYNKGSLLGNEIQRKQTRGESKMEKPIMYFCKMTAGAWDKEIQVTTTQAREPEKVEKTGMESSMTSETVSSPKVDGFAAKIQDNKEDVVLQRDSSDGDATHDIFKDVSEKQKDKEIPVDDLPQIRETFPLQEDISSLEEKIVGENADRGETPCVEQHSDEVRQEESALNFQETLSRHEEYTTLGTLKKLGEEVGKVKEDGVSISKEEGEIFVRNSEARHGGDPNENGKFKVQSSISGNATSSHASLNENTLDESWDVTSRKEDGVSRVETETSGKIVRSTVLVIPREGSGRLEIVNRDIPRKETTSKQFSAELGIKNTCQEARSVEPALPATSANQDAFLHIIKAQDPSSVPDQSQVKAHLSLNNFNENKRLLSRRNETVLKPRKPAITWRSLLAQNRRNLTELKIPFYEQFLINTKNYELANDTTSPDFQQTTTALTSGLINEKEKIFLNRERTKEEVTRKHKSEEDKLQICMEQEIVRFYTKNAYSSLKQSPPAGVCTTLFWQNMTPHRLKIQKQKVLQKCILESCSELPEGAFQGIINKYDKLKDQMVLRHKHEQQALDAVNKPEIQSTV